MIIDISYGARVVVVHVLAIYLLTYFNPDYVQIQNN